MCFRPHSASSLLSSYMYISPFGTMATDGFTLCTPSTMMLSPHTFLPSTSSTAKLTSSWVSTRETRSSQAPPFKLSLSSARSLFFRSFIIFGYFSPMMFRIMFGIWSIDFLGFRALTRTENVFEERGAACTSQHDIKASVVWFRGGNLSTRGWGRPTAIE